MFLIFLELSMIMSFSEPNRASNSFILSSQNLIIASCFIQVYMGSLSIINSLLK